MVECWNEAALSYESSDDDRVLVSARVHSEPAKMVFAIDRSGGRFYIRRGEPVAQLVEHLTFNQVALGSSPSRLTI